MTNVLKDNRINETPTPLFTTGEQQITVACRIRPMTEDEIYQGATIIAHKVANDNMVVLLDPEEDHDDILRANRSRERKYIFDVVSDARADQQDVYAATAKSLISSVLEGYNATVFAYGATGAGKTYTMLGTENNPGIMYRTLNDLFVEIKKFEGKREYQVTMSYLEIYNELIRDLLASPSPSSTLLELREDAKGTIQVAGLSEVSVKTPEDVMHMLHKGNRERTQESTKANKTSSRSHAVLQVNIRQRDVTPSHTEQVRFAKLYMIDLAGSERAAHTQNTGRRMVEGAHINRSLLALGNCINALSDKGTTKYVNYRDSKLTRILKDSLGGNSRTVMIAHISPASIYFEESRNTLNYADRAKYIKTKIRRNVIDVSYHIAQYQQIIQDLRHQVHLLRDQRDDLETRLTINNEAKFARYTDNLNNDRQRNEENLKLKENIIQSYRKQIEIRRALLELDCGLVDLYHEQSRNESLIENFDSSKENSPRSSKKSTDYQQQDLNLSENNAQRARAELRVLVQERSKLEKQRTTQLNEFEKSKSETHHLLEKAKKKFSTGEQKELLKLLTQSFEFEMKSVEYQAEIFNRDFSIKQKDLQLLRLSQHRSLCDTIIHQQRRLIQENQIYVSNDLEELYQLYSRDIDEGQLIHDLKNHSPRSNNGKLPIPFLSQIAEEDLTSASASVVSFEGSNANVRRSNLFPTGNVSPYRTLSDQELFTRLNEKNDRTTTKNLSYSQQNFDSAGKLILTKGISSFSSSSDGHDDSFVQVKRKFNNTSPPTDISQTSNAANSTQNKVTFRRQTQEIAAKAAQKRADLHHRELMGDSTNSYNHESIISKENTANLFGLEVTGLKPKKTVTINETGLPALRYNDVRRIQSDSPELMKNTPLNTINSQRATKSKQKKRSISYGPTGAQSRSRLPVANVIVPREYF